MSNNNSEQEQKLIEIYREQLESLRQEFPNSVSAFIMELERVETLFHNEFTISQKLAVLNFFYSGFQEGLGEASGMLKDKPVSDTPDWKAIAADLEDTDSSDNYFLDEEESYEDYCKRVEGEADMSLQELEDQWNGGEDV